MRIAIFAPEFIPTWGGVGIYAVELVRELSKYKKLEIHVITPRRGEGYDPRKVLRQIGNPSNVFIHNISTASDTFFYNFKFQVGLWRNFKKLHSRYHFDLVHAMNLVHMPDIFLDFGKMGIPHLCTVHTTIHGQVAGFLSSNKNFLRMAPSEKLSLLLYPYIKTLEKAYIGKYSYFITVSEKFVRLLQEEYDFSGKRIIPIHNGIDVGRLDYGKITPERAYRLFPQLKTKKRMVTYAGRLITQKGIQDFISAVSQLDCHAVIAGRGDEQLVRKLIAHYRLRNFTFLGYVQNHDLPFLLRVSGVFVLPSYYENFPISLLEAMAMKVPCVATDVGAVDEIIEDGETGFLLQAGDVPKLVEKIRLLLTDRKLGQKLAKNAYDKVTSEFTSAKMAEKTRKYYREILNKK